MRRGTRAIGGAMCLPDAIWRTQYRELLRLRVLSARRDLKVTLSQIFIGAFACILLSFFQLLANNILGSSTPHYAPTPVGAIPKCETGPGVLRPALSGNASEPGCFTLLYAPASPQVAALVRAAVARSPGLAVGDDVAPVPGLVPFPAPVEFQSFVNASLFAGGGDGATCASAAGLCGDPSYWASGACIPCAWAFDNRTMTEVTTNYPGAVQSIVWAMGQCVGVPLPPPFLPSGCPPRPRTHPSPRKPAPTPSLQPKVLALYGSARARGQLGGPLRVLQPLAHAVPLQQARARGGGEARA